MVIKGHDVSTFQECHSFHGASYPRFGLGNASQNEENTKKRTHLSRNAAKASPDSVDASFPRACLRLQISIPMSTENPNHGG
jgi:hypothetical protein